MDLVINYMQYAKQTTDSLQAMNVNEMKPAIYTMMMKELIGPNDGSMFLE